MDRPLACKQISSCNLTIQLLLRILNLQLTMRKIRIQTPTCMHEFPVRSPDQLPALLQSFRKAAGLTQAETALRLGVTQQTYSALERNAGKVSGERLLQLLNLLGVEMVLQAKSTSNTSADTGVQAAAPAADPADNNGPAW